MIYRCQSRHATEVAAKIRTTQVRRIKTGCIEIGCVGYRVADVERIVGCGVIFEVCSKIGTKGCCATHTIHAFFSETWLHAGIFFQYVAKVTDGFVYRAIILRHKIFIAIKCFIASHVPLSRLKLARSLPCDSPAPYHLKSVFQFSSGPA